MPGVHSVFVDTNVLLYSVDTREVHKRELAWTWLTPLWERRLGRLSWQVLHLSVG
jgi:predicted nucleic acid-binding protein